MLRDKMLWIWYQDLLADEWRQCLTEGRDVADLQAQVQDALQMEPGMEKEARAKALVLALENRPFQTAQHEEEPVAYPDILAALPPGGEARLAFDRARLTEKIKGAWYGRLSGCLLGIPVEGWTRERIQGYLMESGQSPLTAYISEHAPASVREKYGVRDFDPGTPYDRQSTCWRERVRSFPVDDDTNYMMAALQVLARHGRDFTAMDVAERWLYGMPAFMACTAERVAYRNLLNGVLPPESAMYGNPFREWIGAQIRGDVFGYVNPGDPRQAARMAYQDASVSHVKNGVYGEMFVAAVLSLCYGEARPMEDIVREALQQIPPLSRFSLAVQEILRQYEAGISFGDTVASIHRQYDEQAFFDWCHVLPNAMLVTAAILHDQDSHSQGICHVVQAGFDTDCNGATVGSILGLRLGFEALESKWYADLDAAVEAGIVGFDRRTLSELVAQTLRLI